MRIDPSLISRRDAYHLLISAIVPRPIAFVTTMDEAGRTNAAPFSYFTGVSSSPPSLLICSAPRRAGGFVTTKDTQRNIVATREFVVNVVVQEIMHGVVVGGADHPPGVSEIDLAGLRTAPSEMISPPRLADSPVNMECRLMESIEVAGSTIMIGEVVRMHVRDDLLVDGVIDPARLAPIARLGGEMYARLGEIFRMPRA